MKVTVRLFAVARQLAGADEVTCELPTNATVAELRSALSESVPQLAAMLPRIMIAVDSEYAMNETIVTARSEVACIPPVSGG